MDNDIFKANYTKGKDFLLTARKWAVMAEDNQLIQRIDAGLATFE